MAKTKPPRCKKCCKNFVNDSALRRHMRDIHQGRRVYCEFCPHHTARMVDLYKHVRNAHTFRDTAECHQDTARPKRKKRINQTRRLFPSLWRNPPPWQQLRKDWEQEQQKERHTAPRPQPIELNTGKAQHGATHQESINLRRNLKGSTPEPVPSWNPHHCVSPRSTTLPVQGGEYQGLAAAHLRTL